MKKILILFIFFKLINSNIKAQSIGDFYQGGVVFYLDSFGGGLIVDIADLSNPNQLGGQLHLTLYYPGRVIILTMFQELLYLF